MWHVDEGALHAWLDGELDAFPRDEADRIREHLETCPACARRLEEERAVRDQSDAILASAPVDLTGLPSLEEMRGRARGGSAGGGGGGVHMRRLAWAASVVLAVGAGWMTRGIFPGGVDPAPEPFAARQSIEPSLETVMEATETGEAGVAEGRGAGVEDQELPADAGDSPQAALESRRLEAADAGTGAAAADAASGSGAEKTTVAEAEEARVAERRRDLVAERSRVLADAPAPSAPTLSALAPAAAPAAEELSADPMAADPAATDPEGGDPLAVAGLPILSVAYRVPGDPGSGLLVRQRLPDGGTLEVHHLPRGATPDLLGPVPQGMTEWSAERGGAWLVLRGATDYETLRRLGDGILGGLQG